MTTQVYAPAKIILGGEHAVVYGQPAIAFPIDRGVTVSICRASEGWQPEPVLRESFDRLAELCGERVRELEFHVEGTVPAGSGLGSSAAMAVALIRGVHEFFGEPVSDKRVSELAMELETIFHGRPSGVDHTVIAKGQPIYYCRGEATILNVASPLQFVVGLTGTHAGTKQMVEGLRERVQAEPERYNAVFDDIGQIVNAMRDALEQGQAATVGQLMDANQDCLVKLGVSTPELVTLCAMAREIGALGAKLTGAGGGGAMIALVEDEGSDIRRALEQAGYSSFLVSTSAFLRTPNSSSKR